MTQMNPPETAPKDSTVFLGHFGLPWFVPTVYCKADKKFCHADLQIDLYEGEWCDAYFENEYEHEIALLGWIPMPSLPKDAPK